MRRITASTPHIVLSDAIIDLIFQNPLFCLLLLLMKWVWNFKCDIQYLFGLCDIFKSDTISTHSTIIITKKPRYVFWIWKYLLWNHIFYYISIITNFRIKNPSLTPDLQMLASIQISVCLSYRWSTSNQKTDLSYLKAYSVLIHVTGNFTLIITLKIVKIASTSMPFDAIHKDR